MGDYNKLSSTSTIRTRYLQSHKVKNQTNNYIEKIKLIKSVEKEFTKCLMKILEIVNNFKEHIPSITTTDGNPFPYQVHKIHKKQTNRNLNYLIDCNTIAD